MKRTLYPVLAFIAAFVLGACASGSELNATGSIRFSNDISPSQITAQQDNYNPTGLKGASVLRLDSDASRDITGLAGGYDGRVLILHNVGSNPIVLKDASGSSSAANRFALTGDVTLNADAVAILQYDGTSTQWRLAGTSGSISTSIAHSSLTGLTSGDDHTQYALLAGRSGGQTLNGSTAASEHLVLQSTINATEGEVQVKNSDAFRIYDADDTDSIYFSEDGVGNFNITNSTNDLEIHGANDIALYPAGADVQIFGTGGSNFIKLTHDNTDGTLTTSAGDLILSPSTGFVGIGQTSPAFPVDALTSQSNVARFSTTSATTTGCSIHIIQDSATPAASDKVGSFFYLADDSGGTQRVIGRIAMQFDDPTSTSMDSSMIFSTQDAVNAGDYNKNATLTSLGVWTDASLAAGKTFEGKLPDVLDKVKNLRIEKYRSSNVADNSPKLAAAERHYSCTAEDFYAAFGLGKDPNLVDADGRKTGGIAPKDAAFLALDCIQRLIEENDALKARVTALEAKNP